MNTGLGFSEILLIVTIVLIFFGSKEIPYFIRKIAKITATLRQYIDKAKRELDEVMRVDDTLDNKDNVQQQSVLASEKQKMRTQFVSLRKQLGETLRNEKSQAIYEHLKSTETFRNAKAVMVYISVGSEVVMQGAIRDMLDIGKRVIVPYCIDEPRGLGIAEIRDIDNDMVIGSFGIPEPHESLRNKFFRSDIQFIICPGVAFDKHGGRLGRGKAYYDNFLREFKGKVPVWGVAFDCQISSETFPFEYHDITMDQVVTESGLLFPAISSLHPQSESA